MTNSPIRLGVVGVGAIGQNHARVISELPDVELAAICDADTARAAELAEKFGTRAVATPSELAELVDAASVATPTSTHLEVGRTLLEANVHVLVEKPIADNPEDAAALVELARKRDRILQVGHIERFNPVMTALENRLSEPRFIESHRLSPFPNRSLDIGVVLDLMIHDIEIILHLVRDEIASIDAVGVPVLTKREDIANARIRFAGGCVANITASRISPESVRKIRVFQGDCYLSLDYQNQSGEIYRKGLMGIKKETVEVERDEPLKLELASFAECAARGHSPKVSGQEGANALDLAMRITEIIESGDPMPSL